MNLKNNKLFLLSGLIIVDSMHFIFAKMLFPHIAPSAGAMYVLLVGTIQIAIFKIIKGNKKFKITWHQFLMFLSIGFLVGGSTYIDYQAMTYVDPGTAAVLFQSSIFFGMILGITWMREKLTQFQLMGSVFAICGVVMITFQPGNYIKIGSILILTSAFMYALHAVIAKRYATKIEFLDFFFYRLLFTTIFLFLFSFIRQSLIWPDNSTWLLLVMVGTVDVVISRAFYYMALNLLKVSIFSISLTLSPVAAMLWAILFFDSWCSLKQLVGVILVLTGMVFVMTQRVSRVPARK